MQPAAAQELAHDALRVDGRFGCGGGLIGGGAVRVGHHPGSGPVSCGRETHVAVFGSTGT